MPWCPLGPFSFSFLLSKGIPQLGRIKKDDVGQKRKERRKKERRKKSANTTAYGNRPLPVEAHKLSIVSDPLDLKTKNFTGQHGFAARLLHMPHGSQVPTAVVS